MDNITYVSIYTFINYIHIFTILFNESFDDLIDSYANINNPFFFSNETHALYKN